MLGKLGGLVLGAATRPGMMAAVMVTVTGAFAVGKWTGEAGAARHLKEAREAIVAMREIALSSVRRDAIAVAGEQPPDARSLLKEVDRLVGVEVLGLAERDRIRAAVLERRPSAVPDFDAYDGRLRVGESTIAWLLGGIVFFAAGTYLTIRVMRRAEANARDAVETASRGGEIDADL